MPRKARRAAALNVAPRPTAWGARVGLAGYALTALLAAALGSGVTWLAARPKASHAPPPAAAVPLASLLPPDAARVLSYWYEDQKNWPQAIALMNRAISGGQDNPDNRTDLGVDYFQSGQPRQALAQYLIAQQENPQHENSLFNEGSAYAQLGQFPQALAAWRLYLQRFPHGQHDGDARILIAQGRSRPTHAAAP